VPLLRNLKERRNYSGIDLGDQARIAFQVTGDSSIEKIKDTLHYGYYM
jgi:phage repressor protein C with HTH and peptisase S24 domain